ncbi:tripartite tricarboxylate transporter TctB family protein [Neorhizobium sp. NCHU2750]|uniref:tripartite tricarboxylate transporter TctB family protein n=1 Tax=Neorhizobium sp. NCHU2750 TaxID=1825976 RepID=UPI000E7522FA|nr:tricarboxylic transport membrane protein [Neorhizobium sp. NCHU2750]
MNKDLFSGPALLAVAGIYYTWSTQIADSTLSDEIGAAGLPQVLAALLAILSLCLIIRSLLSAKARTAQLAATGVAEDDEEEDFNAPLPRAVGFLLFGAIYICLLPFVGYVVSTALLIGAIALYEGAPRTWVVIAAAVGGGVLYWAIFVKLLGVNQPAGSLLGGLF